MNKKILLLDEYGFSRICSAILESAGYEVTTCLVSDMSEAFSLRDFGLIVTSYPYGAPFFERIVNRHIPVIVLADNIDEKLIRILNAFESSCCMIKPVDFDKFKTLVKEVLSGQVTFQEGYSIV